MSHGKAVAVGPPLVIAEHAGPEAIEVYGSPRRLTEVEGIARARGWPTRRTGKSVSILKANSDAVLDGERRVTNLEGIESREARYIGEYTACVTPAAREND
jgi:lipooligosaccharide transport system ATP-binding protein